MVYEFRMHCQIHKFHILITRVLKVTGKPMQLAISVLS